ncbi:MAG: radical SAM protein [Promethearchaeota archaeon]
MKKSKFNIYIPLKNDQFILYNSLNGSIFALDEEMTRRIEGIEDKDKDIRIDEEILTQLKSQGIILSDQDDELKICKVKYNQFRYNYFGLLYTIVLTYRCNLACEYCYEGTEKEKKRISTMKGENTEAVIQFIKDQTNELNSKVFSIYLFGGEPLINYKEGAKILKVLQEWAEKNEKLMFVGMISNGTLLTEKICDDLKRYNVMHVQLTLDGPQPIHDKKRPYKTGEGTYNDIISSLKLLKNKNLTTKLRINIDSDNYNKIGVLLDDLIRENLSRMRLTFSVISPMTNACKAYSSYLIDEAEIARIIPELWEMAIEKDFKLDLRPINTPVYCGSMTDSAYIIDPELSVYRCYGSVGNEDHIIGNIRDGEFQKNFRYYDFMSRNPFDSKNYEECQDCKLLSTCAGGCALASWVKYGTYHKAACGYLTNVIKERIKLYLKLEYPDKFNPGRS